MPAGDLDWALGSGLIWRLLWPRLVLKHLSLASVIGPWWHEGVTLLWVVLAAAAAPSDCWVDVCRWVLPHLAVRASVVVGRWRATACKLVRLNALWPVSWLSAVDKS